MRIFIWVLREDPGAALQLWETATGELLAEVTFERNQAGEISFNADGTQITMTYDTTSIYDVPHLNLISSGPYSVYTLSPDATTAAYLNEESILTLEHLTTGETRATPVEGLSSSAILRMFFSPDGAALYVVKRNPAGAVFIIDTAAGTLLPGVGGFAPGVSSSTFTPDSAQIVAVEVDFRPEPYASLNPGNGLRFFDLASGQSAQFLPIEIPNEVAISADGVLAYTSRRAIHLVNGGETLTLTDEMFPFFIQHLEFSPDGSLLAGDVGGRLLVLDGRTLDLAAELPTSSSSPFWGDGLLWNDRTLVYADGAVVRFWDTQVGREIVALDQVLPIRGMAFHAATQMLAVNVGPLAQKVRLWDLSRSMPTLMTTFPTFYDDLAFNADGTLLAVGLDTARDYVGLSIAIYDVLTGEVVFELSDCGLPLEFSPDGRVFSCTNPVGGVVVYGVR